MFVKALQATTITLALYVLLGLNALQPTSTENTVEPAEVIVALKQAFTRR
ncbi:MAG: hypothetical protein AAFY72_11440 [Cyanobacteria bacterium J06649_4]